MTNATSKNSEIDWKSVLLELQAFTRSFVQLKGWFRKTAPKDVIKGKQIDDYVYEAIARYLENPEKHDPNKGTLVDYLKFTVLRTLVNNDVVSSENRTSSDVVGLIIMTDENEELSYRDARLPYVQAVFDQAVDYDSVMKHIYEEIAQDAKAEEVFLGLSDQMKRSEIISAFNMTPEEYDNANRRLKTILKNTARTFDLDPK
jgi:hypothetical protein